MDVCMQTNVVLYTSDDLQAEAIVSALPWLRMLRCRDEESVRAFCQSQEVCLVLIVEDPPLVDGRGVFSELTLLHPGLVGVLFSATVDTAILHGALETGFSGL